MKQLQQAFGCACSPHKLAGHLTQRAHRAGYQSRVKDKGGKLPAGESPGQHVTAPAALLTAAADPFLTLASIVADELYQKPLPVIALDPDDFAQLETGQTLRVFADGRVEVYTASASSAS